MPYFRLIDPDLRIRNCKGLNSLVGDLFNDIRLPKQKKYRQNIRDTLRAALINMLDAAFDDSWVSYHRDHRGPEYRRFGWFKQPYLQRVTDHLENRQLIETRNGFFSTENPGDSFPSKMRASQNLQHEFYRRGINNAALECKPRQQLIILRDSDGREKTFKPNNFTVDAERLLKSVNELNSGSHISYGDKQIAQKFLHRVFKSDFKHNGRFCGPEWQWRRKKLRPSIKIDGSDTIELDYSSLHPSMLYALAGKHFSTDMYLAPGYPCDSEADRKFIKRATLTRINSKDSRTAVRSIQQKINFGKLERPAWLDDPSRFMEAIMKQHQAISDHFKPDTGTRLMRLESDLCDSILKHFLSLGVPVLPIHDSFIVPDSYRDELRYVMEQVYYKKFRALCEIK